MSNFDWGTQQEESPEQVAEALEKVTAESHKRRLRRNAMAGATAVVLVATAFIGGANVLDRSGDKSGGNEDVFLASRSEAPAPADTVAPPANVAVPTAPAAAAPAASRPGTLYVAKNGNDGTGHIAAIDLKTGKERKVLATGKTMNDLALSPDGKTLFFTELDPTKVTPDWEGFDLGASLKSVPVDGGPVTFYLYNANKPKVSPDGKKVAVVAYGLSGVSGQVYLVDIATRSSQLFEHQASEKPEGGLWVRSISGWSDNSHILTVTESLEDYQRYAVVYDATRPDAVPTVRFTFPKNNDSDLYDAVRLSNGQLFVVENNGPSVGARMLLIDGNSGAIVKVVATGFVGRAYGNPSADASGNHLIYMSANDVRVSDFGGNPVVVATGVTSATW